MSDAAEYTLSVVITLMIVALMLAAIWVVVVVLHFWRQRLRRNHEIRERQRAWYLRNLGPHPRPNGDNAPER